MEAIEVAQAALADESESETSEALAGENLEQPSVETEEAADADDAVKVEGDDSETESKSQRRRRLRREREEQVSARVTALEQENKRLKERAKSVKAPDPDDYTSEAEYVADMAAYKVRSQDVQAEDERIRAGYDEADSEDAKSFNEAAADLSAEGAEKYADFDAVVKRETKDGGPAVSPIMIEAMLESDMGADIAYYLGKNVKESHKIFAMSPVAQAKAIFNLEAKVAKGTMPAQSQAPAPVKPVRGGSSAPTKPVSEMSMSEYAAYRQKQMNG